MKTTLIRDGVILAPNGQPAWLEELNAQWYEGSRNSPNRSYIWEPVQDARRELNKYTRNELSKHARYLYKNSPLVRGLTERLVTLIIGAGFHPVFKSDNFKWRERANRWWKIKSRNIHLGHKCSHSQYQRAISRARIIDGECFSIKTFDSTVSFEDKVQGIEADRVTGASKTNKQKNEAPVDGFNMNEQGIVVSYNLKNASKPYDAENVVHHYTPLRLGQWRGESLYAAAINTARDVDDILALEKEAVKDASAKRDIIETASGQMDAETFRSIRYGSGSTPFGLPQDDTSKTDYYRMRFGGEAIVLKRGDKYTPYKPERAGSAWTGFMEFLSNTICISAQLPPSILLPISLGGTDIRRDLDIAQRIVEPIQLDILAEYIELFEYFLEGEVYDGELKKDCPDDFSNISWQMPAKLNVDRSQAKEDREDVARGLMSLEEYHGRWCQNAEEVEDTVVKEAIRRKKKIQEAGFTDIKEFIQVLSLNPQLFQQQQPDNKENPKE